MITSIACMQVIERGLLKLDDVELVEKLSPVSVLYPGRRKKPGGGKRESRSNQLTVYTGAESRVGPPG